MHVLSAATLATALTHLVNAAPHAGNASETSNVPAPTGVAEAQVSLQNPAVTEGEATMIQVIPTMAPDSTKHELEARKGRGKTQPKPKCSGTATVYKTVTVETTGTATSTVPGGTRTQKPKKPCVTVHAEVVEENGSATTTNVVSTETNEASLVAPDILKILGGAGAIAYLAGQ